MKKYQQQVNDLVQALASEIIQGKLKSKREINKAIAKLSKDLKIPMDDLIKRLKEQAISNATKATHSSVKEIMALNTDAVVKSITATEIAIVVNAMFNEQVVMQRLKHKSIIDYAVSFMDELKNINTKTVKEVKSVILGGYINGNSPAEIASALIGNQRNKRVRNALKAISKTVLHKAQETANLKTFIKNERYIKWVKYQTVEDERVTHICSNAQKESEELKLSPSKYATQHMPVPSLHFNCRCYLSPQT